MNKAKEHWCCECYHYCGDTGIGEICNRTGKSTYESRPNNSTSCDRWEECICGPLNWEDVRKPCYITDDVQDEDNFESLREKYTEVIKRFNDAKNEKNNTSKENN